MYKYINIDYSIFFIILFTLFILNKNLFFPDFYCSSISNSFWINTLLYMYSFQINILFFNIAHLFNILLQMEKIEKFHLEKIFQIK